MIDLENAIEKLKDEIIFSGVTHEDKSLALDIGYLHLNTVLNIEFEDDDFDTIFVLLVEPFFFTVFFLLLLTDLPLVGIIRILLSVRL